MDWTGLDWTGLEPGLSMLQNGRKTSLKVPGDGLNWTGLDWTGTRSLNAAEWQENLVKSARGWTGLEPGLPKFENGSERLVDFIWIYVD
jgi:hypothetical protein